MCTGRFRVKQSIHLRHHNMKLVENLVMTLVDTVSTHRLSVRVSIHRPSVDRVRTHRLWWQSLNTQTEWNWECSRKWDWVTLLVSGYDGVWTQRLSDTVLKTHDWHCVDIRWGRPASTQDQRCWRWPCRQNHYVQVARIWVVAVVCRKNCTSQWKICLVSLKHTKTSKVSVCLCDL